MSLKGKGIKKIKNVSMFDSNREVIYVWKSIFKSNLSNDIIYSNEEELERADI
ncbi:hypothetical protein ACLMAB_06060 [Brevibacillus laterosporus]